MPQRRPLDALQKAESIGADPNAKPPIPPLTEAVMPLDPAMLESLGKPLSELLGTVLQTPTKTGLPARLRLTGWNADKGNVLMHGVRQAGDAFEATPQQLDTMINAGELGVKQPPKKGVAALQSKIAQMLDAAGITGGGGGGTPAVAPARLPVQPAASAAGGSDIASRAEAALQRIHDNVPVDPANGMKIYNPEGGPTVTPDRAEAALQSMHDALPVENGMKVYNPQGVRTTDINELLKHIDAMLNK